MEWKQKNKNKDDLLGAKKSNVFKKKEFQKSTNKRKGKHSNKPTYNKSRMTKEHNDIH